MVCTNEGSVNENEQADRRRKRGSIKTQWYMIYCIVLVSSILIMLFTCRCSYPQLAHLPLVRDLVDVENRSLSNAKMAFGVDSQIREAVKAKEPAAMLSVSEMTPLAGSRHGNE